MTKPQPSLCAGHPCAGHPSRRPLHPEEKISWALRDEASLLLRVKEIFVTKDEERARLTCAAQSRPFLETKSQFHPSATITRAKIISNAEAWLGTPYVHQASANGAGCDCLGLVRGVWRDLYGREPEIPPAYTPDWNERGLATGEAPLLAAARRHLVEKHPLANEFAFLPGDVLVFRIVAGGPAKHCGIVQTPDRFIHAYSGRAVVASWLNRWWRARIVGVFSFPEVA